MGITNLLADEASIPETGPTGQGGVVAVAARQLALAQRGVSLAASISLNCAVFLLPGHLQPDVPRQHAPISSFLLFAK